MRRLPLLAIVAPLLSAGCADKLPFITPDRPPIAASLTSPCPRLTPLDDGSGRAVLRKLVEVSESYYECARKHGALVEAVGQP